MKLRFSIRDLLWLTAVVALTVGWWLDHSRLIAKHEELVNAAEYQKAKDAVEIFNLKRTLEAVQGSVS
jgi:hypothetical protein